MKRHIYAYKCKKCGHLHYPYRMVCKKCHKNGHNEFEPVLLPEKGKLLTYTYAYNLPADFEVARLCLGMIELENGIRITGQLNIPNPKIGMSVIGKVQTVRTEQYNNHRGIVFYESRE